MSLPTYEEALATLRGFGMAAHQSERVGRADSVGRTLAEDLRALERFPQFDNSGVDGYAVGSAVDATRGARLRLAGASHAGAPNTEGIFSGEAVRVLTGAMVPDGTFGIAMQEDVTLEGETVTLTEPIAEGRHIRRSGDDFEAGAPLLAVGSVLGPGALALLSSQGVPDVAVWARPSATVVVTGDELFDADADLPRGCIRDSNGPMLEALLKADGCGLVQTVRVRDSAEATRQALAAAAESVDLVVCAGGASVGDRDFVPGAVSELGQILFHRVAIRPGKPVLLGKIGGCVVCALPGNPASAFVTYALFVRECVYRLSGRRHPQPRWVTLPHLSPHPQTGRDDFVRSQFVSHQMDQGTVSVAEQGSFGVHSLALAQALVRFPANACHHPGGGCETLLLPGT